MVDRVHRDLDEGDIEKIAGTYHAWKSGEKYADIPGFCKSTTLEEVREQGYVLTPGRYVGAEELKEDREPFEEKIASLVEQLEQQFEEDDKLKASIRRQLERLEYGRGQ